MRAGELEPSQAKIKPGAGLVADRVGRCKSLADGPGTGAVVAVDLLDRIR